MIKIIESCRKHTTMTKTLLKKSSSGCSSSEDISTNSSISMPVRWMCLSQGQFNKCHSSLIQINANCKIFQTQKEACPMGKSDLNSMRVIILWRKIMYQDKFCFLWTWKCSIKLSLHLFQTQPHPPNKQFHTIKKRFSRIDWCSIKYIEHRNTKNYVSKLHHRDMRRY